ncbi:ABC transporter permease protein [Gottschalkia acidurici 9a]|uniref:ABC transporter permease protein n=1 Tax=Gottschalkia acidurici (strain ATCC 7906 / DSM 604 / BCRC 14475 / CIP 104303 / KCTC 5404 / NCIMB 10678 / 9a) TaxID=1128398 RepID=K0AWL8_GOTA9|nr:ABC transporter permease [Gottschalkia acidurici]AFS78223.1 ABC transporter permease protein [Gottschalkia acidurici 9a]
MKSYKDITYRYLKGQRNRTLLTILGIVLSVALISSIGTIMLSAKNASVEDAIRRVGSYHANFKNIDKMNADKLVNHTGISESGRMTFEGSAIVRESTEQERKKYGIDIPYRYIDISAYEQEALDMVTYNLKEGRLPESSDEIAIEHWMLSYFDKDIKLGDKLKLTIGNRVGLENEEKKETFEKKKKKDYTLVGIIEPEYFWRGNLVTTGITIMDEKTDAKSSYNVYVKVPDIKNANEKIKSIAKNIGESEENIEYNNRLLRLSAESMNETFNESVIALLIFVISIIMICTIAVIYNSFNISVLERTNQFGLLRSVGATPEQIREIVLKEAFILSVIGIPLGLFLGLFAMKAVLYIISLLKLSINALDYMKITISRSVFLISSIIGLITVFLSAIAPARRAGKVSPLEAVKNTGSIKKESMGKGRKRIFIRKILGVEGEIAYKNLTRNRKRFIITVFSMVISISLFIIFSSFSNYMSKAGAIDKDELGDFMLYGSMGDETDEIYSKLKKVTDVERVYKINKDQGEILIEENKITKKLKEMSSESFKVERDNLVKVDGIEIFTIGDDNFEMLKSVLEKGSLDVKELNEQNGVLVINNTRVYNQDTNKRSLIKGYNLDVGDKLLYSSRKVDNTGVEKRYDELKVMGILEKVIFENTLGNTHMSGGMSIITTEQVWKELFNRDKENQEPNSAKSVSEEISMMIIQMAEGGNNESITPYLNDLEENIKEFSYIDFSEMARESRKAEAIMNIFLYGFVAIITLISSINIINTISTNIMLRTKEIATIKAVGMTQFGVKAMIALESLYYGIYASIIGGTVGTLLAYMLYRITFRISEFEWTMPWQSIIIACLGSTIIALLSGIYPIKKINDKIIVESIKAEN